MAEKGISSGKSFKVKNIGSLESSGADSYVRCRYCDSSFSDKSGCTWIEVHKQEPRCRHKEARFKCPACGFESDSFIFSST